MKKEKDIKIGILGTGVMGSQIALLFARNGFTVTVWDIKDKESIGVGLKRLDSDTKNRIHIVTNLTEISHVDFIEECLPEDLEVKKEVLNTLKNVIDEKTVVATNTSSLSVQELSKSAPYPESFVGIHFFNPVDSIRIVEVVFFQGTSIVNRELVNKLLEITNRKVIYVADSPGFIVNRLLIPMINDAANLLNENVATAKEIDNAMKLGAKHPMGPLALVDFIGLDICLSIMKNLNAQTDKDYYKISPLLERLVKNGYMGRKTKKGFYEY